MTNKNKSKQSDHDKKLAKAYKKRQAGGTMGPYQTAGAALGAVGGFVLGGPPGAVIGSALGSAGGNLAGYYTGTGNYKVSQNAVLNANFQNRDSTVITHREYVTDIKAGSGTPTNFDIVKFPLNPGSAETFPWLSGIASNYEEYEILGMVFTFVSTSGNSIGSTNTALGTVILATEYDPTKPDFVNKQAMENYMFATSNKPSEHQIHAIECKKNLTPVKMLYVRTGANTGTDLRWTDFGNFYIATVGNPLAGANLGELWVTYKVRLSKPRLPVTVGAGGQISSGMVTLTACTTANPAGTSTLFSSGNNSLQRISNTQLSFRALPNMDYVITVYAYGAACGFTPLAYTGASQVPFYKAKTAAFGVATAAVDTIYSQRVTCTNTDTDGVVLITMTTISVGVSIDVFVSQVDETL
jgi:hypothetical protein